MRKCLTTTALSRSDIGCMINNLVLVSTSISDATKRWSPLYNRFTAFSQAQISPKIHFFHLQFPIFSSQKIWKRAGFRINVSLLLVALLALACRRVKPSSAKVLTWWLLGGTRKALKKPPPDLNVH